MTIGVRWQRANTRGCCAYAKDVTYNDYTHGLDDCKRMCFANSNCGWINYSDDKWCTIIHKNSDCSQLLTRPSDCGKGGANIFYVYKYLPRHGNTLVAFI